MGLDMQTERTNTDQRSGFWRGPAPKGLLLANAALVGVLGTMLWMDSADAQAVSRASGRYIMLSGEMQGVTTPAVYILDTANQEMVGIRWDERTQRTAVIGFRDLRADAGDVNAIR